MWLCGFCYEAFHVESYLALCSHDVVFSVRFSTVMTSLGEERAGLVYMYVYLACVTVCLFLFLLVSGIGCKLIVALP